MEVVEREVIKFNHDNLKLNNSYNVIKLDGFSIPVNKNSKFKFIDLNSGFLIGEYDALQFNAFEFKDYNILTISMLDDLLTIGVIKKENL